jgi:CheY-like chemotaxis protein
MDLNFKILWIEDTPSWQKATQRSLKKFLDDRGLDLIVTTYRSPTALLDAHKSGTVDLNEHDLFLIDYKFGSHKSGGELIDKIRAKEIYTNVIFYSQDGETKLRTELAERQLEGVYCLDRRTGFSDKALRIIEATIKQVEDLNFLRGFVMAETSELDANVLTFIVHQFSDAGGLDSKQKSSAHKKASSYVQTQLEKNTSNLATCTSHDLVTRLCDASKRFRLLKHIAPDADKELKARLNSNHYDTDIIKRRNMLAHVKASKKDGKIILVSTMPGHTPEVFDHSLCFEIRKKIKHYKLALNDLGKHLKLEG